MKVHSFGKTNPNSRCFGKFALRQPICGILTDKEHVTNIFEKVTCKNCLKLAKETDK